MTRLGSDSALGPEPPEPPMPPPPPAEPPEPPDVPPLESPPSPPLAKVAAPAPPPAPVSPPAPPALPPAPVATSSTPMLGSTSSTQTPPPPAPVVPFGGSSRQAGVMRKAKVVRDNRDGSNFLFDMESPRLLLHTITQTPTFPRRKLTERWRFCLPSFDQIRREGIVTARRRSPSRCRASRTDTAG